MYRIIALVFLTMAFLGASLSRSSLRSIHYHRTPDTSQLREVMMVPSPQAARLISLGYRNLTADLLWFKTIAYFGGHLATDGTYPHFNTLCRSITQLNPKALHVSMFCAKMLAWEMGKPREGIQYLTDAVVEYPNDWMLYYLRGFYNLYFFNDRELAKTDLIKAASFPECHPTVKRLAAKNLALIDGPQSAIALIDIMLQSEKEQTARDALLRRREELVDKLSATQPSNDAHRHSDAEAQQP